MVAFVQQPNGHSVLHVLIVNVHHTVTLRYEVHRAPGIVLLNQRLFWHRYHNS